MKSFLASLLLLYPSIPYFSFGWGINFPFAIIAFLFLLSHKDKNAVPFAKMSLLYLPASSLGIIWIAALIMWWRLGSMEFTNTILGFRDLLFTLIICGAFIRIFNEYHLSFISRGLIYGLLLNLGYGIIEILIPGFSYNDEILHEHSRYAEYLFHETHARVRLLWSEPSQASMYLCLSLPLILLLQRKLHRYSILLLWVGLFVKVASKGTLFFLALALILFSIIRPWRTIAIVSRNFHFLILIPIIGISAAFLTDSELINTFHYVTSVVEFVVTFATDSRAWDDIYLTLLHSDISESQYVRFVNTALAVQNLFVEPYALITGFSPWGMKYYLALNPDLVPEGFKLFSGLATRYSDRELHAARHLVQSAFFEQYVSYGLPIFYFLFLQIKTTYARFVLFFPKYSDLIFLFLLWMLLSNTFMIFIHIVPIAFIYRLFTDKLNAVAVHPPNSPA